MLRATSKTAVVALIASLAACSDGTLAPKSDAPQSVSGQGSLAELTQTDTVHFSFVINPAVSQSFYLGAGNSVHFPAGAVCDPNTSSYGTTEWDNPCTPATAPITITASAWLDPVTAAPRVDFDNHIRFVPTDDPTQWVTLGFTDESAALDSSADILYCTTSYSDCVSELQGDSTLVTVKDPVTGVVTRRIKHFSGYLLGSGDDCDSCDEGGSFNRAPQAPKVPAKGPSVSMLTPMRAPSSAQFASLASGYMFATGESFNVL